MLLVLLATLGLAAEPVPTGSAPHPGTQAHDHVPTVSAHGSVGAAVRAGLAGKAAIACSDLLDLGDVESVRSALIEGTRASMPPWAPMRAATCLTELAATDDLALDHVRGLVADAEHPGFALAVAERLSELPEPRAVRLAQHALTNTSPALQARLPARLDACEHSAVRALTR